MADDSYLSSPIEKYRKPTSSIFGSPKIFLGFSPKGFTNAEYLKSPTSILDSRPFFALKNPFSSDKKTPKYDKKSRCDTLDSRKIGLAIIEDSKSPQFGSKMVVFGSKLKIQIPPLPPPVIPPSESPKSPSDFGIKSKNYQFGSRENSNSTRIFTGFLSANAMELSEDYTRVISHGPNPRTTHIFDNCIIENCSGGFGFSGNKSMMSFPSESFLSCCYACKKQLGEGIDIYIYRGEKAFCSSECRYKEMMLEEKLGESDYD